MWGERRTSRARSATAVLVIIFLVALGGLQGVRAAGPDPWPCLQPGWTAGDQWGPGPDDVVPDAPPCPFEQQPQPSGLSVSVGRPLLAPTVTGMTPKAKAARPKVSQPTRTLPPTDTEEIR